MTAAVNSDVETSSHQQNTHQSSCATVPTTTSTSTSISMESQLASLRAEVQRQQTTIATLQTQLSFVLSLLGVKEPDIEPISHEDNYGSGGAPISVDNHTTNQLSWSTVTANIRRHKKVAIIFNSRWLPPSTTIRLKADDESQA